MTFFSKITFFFLLAILLTIIFFDLPTYVYIIISGFAITIIFIKLFFYLKTKNR